MNQVIEFLSDAFDEGLEFSTIAGYRSAISAYHDPIDGCLLYTSPSPRDGLLSRMPSSA